MTVKVINNELCEQWARHAAYVHKGHIETHKHDTHTRVCVWVNHVSLRAAASLTRNRSGDGAALPTLRCLYARHTPQQRANFCHKRRGVGGERERWSSGGTCGNRGNLFALFFALKFRCWRRRRCKWLNWMPGKKNFKLQSMVRDTPQLPSHAPSRPAHRIALYLQIHLIYAFRLFPLAGAGLAWTVLAVPWPGVAGKFFPLTFSLLATSFASDLACLSG